MSRPHAVIIGGGLAGLAAAAGLAPRGWRVTILESKSRLGGRAGSFTDSETGEQIDVCQHVSMGCCTNFAYFCKTVGIDQFLAPQPTLYFMTPDRRVSEFHADRLPAPFHLARSFWRAHFLTKGEKLRVAWGLRCLNRERTDADPPFLPWLQAHRQTPGTIERFWSVVLVSALNESVERVGLKYARKVFREAFWLHRRGFEVQVPTVPLGRLYGDELMQWFARHRATVKLNEAAVAMRIQDGDVRSIELRSGERMHAQAFISAIPFDRLPALLGDDRVRLHATFSSLRNLSTSPITSVHLWFDRPVTPLPHVVFVGCLSQWLFNRGESRPGEHYVQIVVSAAHDLKKLPAERIQQRVHDELRGLFPNLESAALVRSKVITDQAATFSVVPGVDQWRPRPLSPLRHLYLAGDWTDTGWPATMEGAVRSGYLAAEAVLGQKGIVQPDL